MTKSIRKIIVSQKFASTDVFQLKEVENSDTRGSEILLPTPISSKIHIIVAYGGLQ